MIDEYPFLVRHRQSAVVIVAEVILGNRTVAALKARHEGEAITYELCDWPGGWLIASWDGHPSTDEVHDIIKRMTGGNDEQG